MSLGVQELCKPANPHSPVVVVIWKGGSSFGVVKSSAANADFRHLKYCVYMSCNFQKYQELTPPIHADTNQNMGAAGEN